MKRISLIIVSLFVSSMIFAQANEDPQKDTSEVKKSKENIIHLEDAIDELNNLSISNKNVKPEGQDDSIKEKESKENIIHLEDALDELNNFNGNKNIKRNKKEVKPEDEIKTLVGSGSNGFYIGGGMQYAQLENTEAIYFDAKLAFIMNHAFAMGFYGEGFASDSHYNSALDYSYMLSGGHGGIFIEQILFPKMPVHLSVPVKLGLGGIVASEDFDYQHDQWDNSYSWDSQMIDGDVYVIFKPGVELEVNMTKHFRLGVGAYYNYTSEIHLHDYDTQIIGTNPLEGFSYGFTIKLGKF